MKIHFFSIKRLTWLVNMLLFNLCRLFIFRNKKIWVFGAREGHNYDDNSRYLFEYLNNKHSSNFRYIWISRSDDVVELVRSLGLEAYSTKSFKGKLFELRAGVSIYTNGLLDFGMFPLVGGSIIVSLWHGVGFKKVYNSKYSGIALNVKKIMDIFFSWTHRDVTLATSKYTAKLFVDNFSLTKKDKIFITGQPRNDILRSNFSKEAILSKLNIDYTKKVILYMPTYRSKELGKDAIDVIVKKLYDCVELNETLNNNNLLFLVKLHPLTPHINLIKRDNFVILDYNAIDSNQALLGIGDMMITDYSSVCVDFALLNRPVLFYMPDETVYLEKSEKLFKEFFDISANNKFCNPVELANGITKPSMTATRVINDIYEDNSIKNSSYSENVYNVITKMI